MKLFRRITWLSFFGAGYLLGSRSGPGAWEKAQAKFNEVQGKAQREMSDGQMKDKFEQAKDQMKAGVSGAAGDNR